MERFSYLASSAKETHFVVHKVQVHSILENILNESWKS